MEASLGRLALFERRTPAAHASEFTGPIRRFGQARFSLGRRRERQTEGGRRVV